LPLVRDRKSGLLMNERLRARGVGGGSNRGDAIAFCRWRCRGRCTWGVGRANCGGGVGVGVPLLDAVQPATGTSQLVRTLTPLPFDCRDVLR